MRDKKNRFLAEFAEGMLPTAMTAKLSFRLRIIGEKSEKNGETHK